ncbi:DUF4232 domain-containing protein [Kitasatospora sp. NPDC086801]|uniref:DUF4232 domain-containing protein n=1 Tax=Kitasatospora sp. NPDC086801 TaxID=3364066 RepID=UPI00381FD86A
MRVHKLTFAALAVAASLSLTACQGDDGGSAAQSKPSSAPSVSTASSPGGGSASGSSSQGSGTAPSGTAPSGTGSSGTASGGSASGGSGQGSGTASGGTAPSGTGTAAGTSSAESDKGGKCRTDDLAITAVDRTIDGDRDRTVVVELKNHSGHDCAISGYAGVDLKTNAGSLSAQRSGEPVVPDVLKNGKSTFFGISYPINASGGSGVRVTGLVVTPPDETKSVTLPWPGAGTLPATNGNGSPVKIGPMGSAGQGE